MIKVSKAIIKDNEKYLLLKRAHFSKSFPNTWDFPGGKMDIGEAPIQTVLRETKEETNLDITVKDIFKEEKYKDDKFDLLFYYFIPTKISGNIKLSSDHSDLITEF